MNEHQTPALRTPTNAATSDRELLEAAAKAAGVPGEYLGGDIVSSEDGSLSFWNPLRDDGQALRLAAKLHMDIQIDMDVSSAVLPLGDTFTEPNLDGDLAATRRAIVRAAAALPRSALSDKTEQDDQSPSVGLQGGEGAGGADGGRDTSADQKGGA